jgi:hypothetical protein
MPLSQVWQLLEARTEGRGLNAVVRGFKKAKNTVAVPAVKLGVREREISVKQLCLIQMG